MEDYNLVPTISSTDRCATQTTEYIDSAMAHADAAYKESLNLLNSLSRFAQFVPIDTNVGWTDLPTPSTVALSALGTIPLPPTLDDIPAPAINWDYLEVPYFSDLLTALKNKLLYDILNGSVGLTSAVEQEIYDRESERNVRQLSDTIDRTATRWAESGFTLPDGVLSAMLSWADIEYQNKRSDVSRKIAEDSLKLGIENAHFTIEKSITLEGVMEQFNTETNKNKIEAAKAILQAGIAIFDSLIKEKLARVDLYKGEAQAYEAYANAVGSIANVDIALYAAQTNYNKARSDTLMKSIELQIEQMKVELLINTEIAKAISDVASRLAAGALSGISASASIGWSGSDANHVTNSSSGSININDDYSWHMNW